jgi:hypothetical protein
VDVKRALQFKRRRTQTGGVWTKPGDSYEKHEPKPLAIETRFDKIADKIAPIRTHERVLQDFSANLFGVEVGLTLSQLELVRKNTHGVEVVQVVNKDGSSNIETILARWFFKFFRVELQGPAINTSVTPGQSPVGARIVGLGVTNDKTSAMDHDALSYTMEVKLTEKSIAQLAASVGAGTASAVASGIASVAGSEVAKIVGDVVLGAVPVISVVLAAQSARRAYHMVRDDTASTEMKVFAVSHAIADGVRVALPLVGTLMNAGLVAAAAIMGWTHHRYAKHAPPTGPPGDDATPGRAGRATDAG